MGNIDIIVSRNLFKENITDLKFAWEGRHIADLFKPEYRLNDSRRIFNTYPFSEKLFNCTDNYDGTVKFSTTDEISIK